MFSVAVTLVSGAAGGPALAAASGPFLAHQALYELKLVKSRGSNAITRARGRILYNFSGNACEGYTSEFRQVSELDSGEGKLTLSDLRSTSWEDAEGKSIHMPNPSFYPFVVSVGVFVGALGLLIDNPKIKIQLLNMPTLCAIGLVLVFAGIYGWAFEPASD